MVYAFVPIFGVGWSVTILAGTVLLIRYFGSRGGTAAQSTIWTVAGLATAGPYVAGLIADRTGSFVSSLTLLGLLLLPVALASLVMGPARGLVPGALAPSLTPD
jgi:cyanate permease